MSKFQIPRKVRERSSIRSIAEMQVALNKILDLLPFLVIKRSKGLKRRQSANGVTLVAEGGSGTDGEDGKSGMVFRGSYDNTKAYKFNEVVRVDSGVHAGTYVAINDIPANQEPWTNVNWILIGRIKDAGLSAG